MVGSGGPKCRCGRWLSSFRRTVCATNTIFWQITFLTRHTVRRGSPFPLKMTSRSCSNGTYSSHMSKRMRVATICRSCLPSNQSSVGSPPCRRNSPRVEIVAANAGSVTVAIPTYRSTYGMISASSQCLLSTNFTAACLRKLRSLEVIPKYEIAYSMTLWIKVLKATQRAWMEIWGLEKRRSRSANFPKDLA